MRYCVSFLLWFGVLSLAFTGYAQAQDSSPAPPDSPPAATAATPPLPVPQSAAGSMAGEPVTVLLMLKWGGVILWITMAMGFVAMAMAIYLVLTVTPKREVPVTLTKRLLGQIRAGDLRGAYQLCEGRDELLANVARAGLKMAGHDRYVVQEAMESEGERGASALWQKISYLNNAGTIAPLLGLLGTVWGMVLAFSSIASDNAQVRGIVVAENVSKALITTVGGLVVAIPCMVVYYYLRARVVKIVAEVEAQASEIVELLAQGRQT